MLESFAALEVAYELVSWSLSIFSRSSSADIPTNASSEEARGRVPSSDRTRHLTWFGPHIVILEINILLKCKPAKFQAETSKSMSQSPMSKKTRERWGLGEHLFPGRCRSIDKDEQGDSTDCKTFRSRGLNSSVPIADLTIVGY
jgi:hypothetical protein